MTKPEMRVELLKISQQGPGALEKWAQERVNEVAIALANKHQDIAVRNPMAIGAMARRMVLRAMDDIVNE